MGFSRLHILLIPLTGWLALKYFSGPQEEFQPDVLIKQKKVLVTGASSGIGKATALRFCQLGANVYITARTEKKLQDVVTECRRLGAPGSVHGYLTGDMANLRQAERIVHESVKALGGLDFLILNHAFTHPRQLHMFPYTPESLTETKTLFEINFFSYVAMTSAAMRYLRESGGKVAVISSVLGRRAFMMTNIYGATKSAVAGFFRSIDLENYFLRTNVSFTVAHLGLIDSQVVQDLNQIELANVVDTYFRHGVDFAKWLADFNAAADVDECAEEIIRSTALRRPEFYFPRSRDVWWPVLKSHLFPDWLRSHMDGLRVSK